MTRASYRDLLGTAERIIEMDGQMREVELVLGGLGKKCNSRMLDRIGKNYANMDKSWKARGEKGFLGDSECSIS